MRKEYSKSGGSVVGVWSGVERCGAPVRTVVDACPARVAADNITMRLFKGWMGRGK